MKYSSFLFLMFISSCAFAQVGRNELPNDTIPIGGKTEEYKLNKMESQEELATQLTSLRDSISSLMADKNNMHKNVSLSERKKQLDQLIKSLKSTQNDPALIKQGYSVLHEVRAELKAAK